ncbi:MAG: hypothetical protein H6737_29800 [Alphaproteobacteria bacterium]|nr:hypothetical protein [Alphaproteobacteria bacterium]
MKDPRIIRRKALLSASSVVLALGAGCVQHGTVPVVSNAISPIDTGRVDTAALDTAVDTDAVPMDEPDCTLPGVDMFPCCDERAAWCTQQHASVDAQNECLFGPGFDGSTGCIPWGPPAPPRMGAYA